MRKIIILILLVVVLITLFYVGYTQPKKEGFVVSSPNAVTQLTTLLQQMSSNVNSLTSEGSSMTPEQQSMKEELINQLNNLNSSLEILINMNQLNTSAEPNSTYAPDINLLNDARVQQMKQDDSINELKRRLANLQKIYTSYLQKQSEATIKYDKIPVYSSCIVSEADGRYTYPTNSPSP
jgi:type I site-specific restriction-modification system R (restriction) subunit